MARNMEAPRIDKTATSRLLIGLALCAALMSGAFFLHVRRDAEDHGSVSGASAQLLPGLTLYYKQVSSLFRSGFVIKCNWCIKSRGQVISF